MISKSTKRQERRHKTLKAEARKRNDRWHPRRPDNRRALLRKALARDGEG